eukprot:4462908-Alexandrium_andersonii.AAC.1
MPCETPPPQRFPRYRQPWGVHVARLQRLPRLAVGLGASALPLLILGPFPGPREGPQGAQATSWRLPPCWTLQSHPSA